MIKIITLGDMHVPFEDKEAVKCAFAFCKQQQPAIIITHEWHDFYPISRFNKDPRRINDLQLEIDKVGEYFKKLRKLCPDSTIIFLESNHLRRLKRFLWGVSPALVSLRCLAIKNLLEIKKYNVKFGKNFTFREVLFKHGDVIRRHSAYTARAEFEREGMSTMTGHTHRLGQGYYTRRGGVYTSNECGCLCDLSPEWFEGVPDWQQGIGMALFEGTHYRLMGLPIIDRDIMWG